MKRIIALLIVMLWATAALGAGIDITAPSYTGPTFGTLTNGKYCIYTTGTGIVCNSDAGSGLATDALWDAAGDLVYGTGANTAARLPAGTAYYFLRMNSGGTAPEWTGTLNLSTVNLPSSDADPATTAGQIRHDTDPNVLKWYDGAGVRIIGGALTPVIDDPDNFAANFTGKNFYGGTFIANAAGTAALPVPAVGMNFTFVLETAEDVVVDPAGDTIVMNGLAAAANENITATVVGAMCVFQYRAANSWMATCKSFTEATPP